MAGHNKWSKIRHTKGAADAKRGRAFSKVAHEISIATRQGGKDPDLNPRLRQAIAAARSQNMPGDNIQRAIKKGAGEIEGVSYEEITYEGYGPAGVAMLVEAATDNKNRTAASIRSAFNKHNGSMGNSGSVAYLFNRRGEIQVPLDEASEEKMLDIALEAGADDALVEGDAHVLLTAQDKLAAVAEAVRHAGLEVRSQKLIYVPQTSVTLSDVSIAIQVIRLYEALDNEDDTINVFSNFDLAEEVMDQIHL